ncbi:hypothetical protein M0220_00320 [Halomonas qinghailakensis]|uniref:Uncharacterized protein n=1 Tax=Halomonas qinghailakensis TaxID=2937790 RepID=A0AA46TQE0_9GAMM|nr:hypothetical protein [Halomonas sp. ZZQ-149]UYO74643.1 hypothetical protein M0220_00320 [Halomonas sp. ZZQ-149]
MKKSLSILLYFVAFSLPVYLFEITYRSQFSELELNSGGVYRDAPNFYLLLSLILAFLVAWASTQFSRKIVFWFIVIFVNILFYIWMCFFVATESMHLRGTTWPYIDILNYLVLNKWYFYVFGSVGIALLFLLPLNSGERQ